MRCISEWDGYRCEREQGHRGKHLDFGTDAEPCSVKWTDQGVNEVRKEQEISGLPLKQEGS